MPALTNNAPPGPGPRPVELVSELLRKRISPERDVLLVGPHISPFIDPSALCLATLMAGGKGSLTLMDVQAPSLYPRVHAYVSSRNDAKHPVPFKVQRLYEALWHGMRVTDWGERAAGDPFKYRVELSQFRNAGVRLLNPKILITDATSMQVESGRYDRIVDYGSLKWIGSREAVSEYMRVLKPGGQALLFFDSEPAELRQWLTTSPKPRPVGDPEFAVSHWEELLEFQPEWERLGFSKFDDNDVQLWRERNAFEVHAAIATIESGVGMPRFGCPPQKVTGQLKDGALQSLLDFLAANQPLVPYYACPHWMALTKR